MLASVVEDLLLVEDALWVLTRPTGKGVYDLAFDRLLACRRPYHRPDLVTAVARVGAIPDYADYHRGWLERGVRLIHDPDQHRRASELPGWYPLIEDLTPRSVWFAEPPPADVVEAALGWPIFMKGSRQTSGHRKSLAIVDGPDAYRRAIAAYAQDAILHWQELVCRRFVPLRPVGDDEVGDRVPTSFELRSFWWRGELVGFGRYWWEGRGYDVTPAERRAAIALGAEAARRVDVPFLVVDLAQDVDGNWLVIECNDGQESGHAGVSALGMWQRIVELERARQRAAPAGT